MGDKANTGLVWVKRALIVLGTLVGLVVLWVVSQAWHPHIPTWVWVIAGGVWVVFTIARQIDELRREVYRKIDNDFYLFRQEMEELIDARIYSIKPWGDGMAQSGKDDI